MRNAFTKHMYKVGCKDAKLIVLIGDISHFALQPFAESCPGRFYNIGILEPTIISMAAGLAHTGYYPVVHTIAPFIIERGLEQIKLDFCYQEQGGNLISVGSAFDYSSLGCSHHCYDDISIIKTLPRTQVVYPSMPKEFNALFDQTYNNKFLTYFRLPNHKHGYDIAGEELVLGKGILMREGSDVTLVTTGPQLKNTMNAAEKLLFCNINTEVIYIHTPKPFDYNLVAASVSKTKRVITIEEHSIIGGIGDEVLRATAGIGCKFIPIGIKNEFCHGYGSYEEHCKYFGITANKIIEKSKDIIKQ